jgi:DNA polymerase-4
VVHKIIHVDMDAFYASIEQRDDPSLRGRPLVVGGRPDSRGVVAAASYEAREFGIHSAMPASRAVRLCPQLAIVPPDFARYKAVSTQLHTIFRDFTDLIEPLSLDEAFLDVTTNKLGLATATEVAVAIRARVREELGLTCSAGVAPLKFVAKIASDYRKPDGLTVVPPSRILEFVHPMPVRKLWGVGPATAARLQRIGVNTIGDLAALPDDAIAEMGKHGRFLVGLARGHDPRGVSTHRERKSRGSERTFAEDVHDLAELEASIRSQAQRVVDARDGADRGRTITVKVRYDDFTTITRSRTLPKPITGADQVAAVAVELLGGTEAGTRPVRLVGVTISGFGRRQQPQLDLPFPHNQVGSNVLSQQRSGPERSISTLASSETVVFGESPPPSEADPTEPERSAPLRPENGTLDHT